MLCTFELLGQSSENLQLPYAKRFINKIEVFAGSNLSFNYGNMFIENYRGEYANDNFVINERQLKPGYLFGLGVYHPLSRRIDLNFRLLYEKKGTKNELNSPSNPVNTDARLVTLDEYSYNYLTVNASPNFYFGPKKKWSISVGGYFSKIKSLKGSSKSYDTRGYQDQGIFEGRYFYHLREDGAMDGFSWNPFLTSIETFDFGLISSFSYEVFINLKHSILVQLQDNYGLQNINKDNTYGLKERNHSIALIISYNFKLPSKQ